MQAYWKISRPPRYSLLFALPLLVLYETLALLLSDPQGGVRNAADVILKSAFTAVAGGYGPILFGAVLIGVSVWIILRDAGGSLRSIEPRIFGFMAAESAALALVFGVVVGTITAQVIGAFVPLAIGQVPALTPAQGLMVSLGAGLYEELLFRVIIVGALAYLGRRVLGWNARTAGIAAAVVGALIFAAFHYVGPYGDPLRADSFVFRALGGLAFSALYLWRGFGITAWTHALYDVAFLFR